MRKTLVIPLTAAAVAALPAAGETAVMDAAGKPWATVNICDTLDHQNEMGVRGSMPALARRSRMFMRFRVQYKTLEGEWRMVASSDADSGWSKVKQGRHDAGWTFAFKPPAAGGAHILRGVVSFQWRRSGRVVKRDRRITEDGHPGTVGADPADFSAGTCAIA